MTGPTVVDNVTCLGCGCVCDDVAVTVQDGTIVQVAPTCAIGRAWFGDGIVPTAVLSSGAAVPLDAAITEAARSLAEADGHLLVYLGPDLSSEAQRRAVALADLLRATVDSGTSETAAAGLLAAQRRGRAAATLGEIRNRADVIVFWGVDTAVRYPRFLSRYAVDPVGTHIPDGRAGRTVISVTIGAEHGPEGADVSLTLEPGEELAALSVMRAVLLGQTFDDLSPRLRAAAELVSRLAGGRYVALVHDAEPGPQAGPRDPLRAEGLMALAQTLNGPTRAALISLRAGGNRSGTEAVLTWQTGYPFAVDFSTGAPRYTPRDRGLARLGSEYSAEAGRDAEPRDERVTPRANGDFVAALVVGAISDLTAETVTALAQLSTVVIGPRASQAAFRSRVAIDTGVAGIHEGGTAYRMDEVPLPLRPPLPGPRTVVDTLTALTRAVIEQRAASPGAAAAGDGATTAGVGGAPGVVEHGVAGSEPAAGSSREAGT